MDTGFKLDSRHSIGNLHIDLSGEFNGMCAWELIKTIKKQRTMPYRIFVNTAKLDEIAPSGVELFKCHMEREKMPKDWLYFKGEKGFKIAPNDSRVILRKKSCKS